MRVRQDPMLRVVDGTLERRLQARRASQRFAWLIISLVSLTAIIASVGFLIAASNQEALNETRRLNREMRGFQQALVDAETGVRGFVVTGEPEYLQPYEAGLQALSSLSPEFLGRLDSIIPRGTPPGAVVMPTSQTVEALRNVWSKAVYAASSGRDLTGAQEILVSMHAKDLMDRVRSSVREFVSLRDIQAEKTEIHIAAEQHWTLFLNLAGAAAAIGSLIYAFDRSIRDAWRREAAIRDNTLARKQVELLFVMAEMLQSATDREDANEVLRATGTRLLPGLKGALYVFNNSRDRLDLSTTWGNTGVGEDCGESLADHLTPVSCWALKRGKPHRNEAEEGTLRCAHAASGTVSLELPMAARGEVYGLLALSAKGADAEIKLTTVQPIATALADAMSLALSSISLRERLRNQALRDPLTGLYNRRFLEEMIERLSGDAERRRAPLSAMMLDLDHFKILNDQFGHATGDAVLKQVSNTILTTLRGSDVACRYGGEEIAILLPDCAMEETLAKANLIREAIASMSSDGGSPPVTASIGVANIPATTTRAVDLLQAADGALYAAKQQGRNRVVAAPARQQAPKLVVSE